MEEVAFPIAFWKMSGAGNDFIVIDHRKPLVPPHLMAEFARKVCRRKFSVGADGLFFLEPSAKADFSWRFFNADGSEAEMCGNGARCVARFAYMNGMAAARMRFETLAGLVEASVSDTQITIGMPAPHSLTLNLNLEQTVPGWEAHSINTGVPHLVVFVKQLDQVDVAGLGRQLRYHPQFVPAGTNVNFVERSGQDMCIRTYERGVEDETMACGTGAVAAALVASAKGYAQSPVTITTSGGVTLTVLWSETPGKEYRHIQLKGPAHLIYRGELTPEALIG